MEPLLTDKWVPPLMVWGVCMFFDVHIVMSILLLQANNGKRLFIVTQHETPYPWFVTVFSWTWLGDIFLSTHVMDDDVLNLSSDMVLCHLKTKPVSLHVTCKNKMQNVQYLPCINIVKICLTSQNIWVNITDKTKCPIGSHRWHSLTKSNWTSNHGLRHLVWKVLGFDEYTSLPFWGTNK